LNKSLFKRLVLPLILLIIIAVFIHIFFKKADGFFLNLSTELIGILITICYVDWILREHEHQRWLSTDNRIIDRLQILLNATISGLRDGLCFGIDVFDERARNSRNAYAAHKDVIRVGEHIISPAALSRVKALDQAGWTKLARHIQKSHNSVLSFLNLFQNRLSPNQISYLLDMQESLDKSLTYYTIFPDIMGVPKDKLPKATTSPEELQQFGCESTANEIQKICILAKNLSESTDQIKA